MADNSDIPANLLARMSPSDIMQFRQALAASQGGGADAQRNNIAQAMMPQQALSGGQVQYSQPSAPTGVAPQPGNADIPPELLARMSPQDIMLFRQASAGQAIPTGVAGPYGGGAMGQPQIPSGYNAFSGAGLPATNIGQGGLYGGGYGGNDFFGGGNFAQYRPPQNPNPSQTETPSQFGGPDTNLYGFPGSGQLGSMDPFGGYNWGGNTFNQRFDSSFGGGGIPYGGNSPGS
jgi:hypothetical protein